jgi:hypothetical protein
MGSEKDARMLEALQAGSKLLIYNRYACITGVEGHCFSLKVGAARRLVKAGYVKPEKSYGNGKTTGLVVYSISREGLTALAQAKALAATPTHTQEEGQ